MNLIDKTVVEIIEGPYQRIDDDFCCWEVKVITNCYGCKKEELYQRTSKKLIDKIKVGYSEMV